MFTAYCALNIPDVNYFSCFFARFATYLPVLREIIARRFSRKDRKDKNAKPDKTLYLIA
jgi:hypothetical protein